MAFSDRKFRFERLLINGVMVSAEFHPAQAKIDPFLRCPFWPLFWPIPSADVPLSHAEL